MATSGKFNTSGYSGRYLTFSWELKSQSVANNTSTIEWTLKGAGGSTTSWFNAGNFKVVINGKTVYSSTDRIKLYNGTEVASGTLTIAHNTDGTKSFGASAEAGIYTVAVNCKGSGSWSINAIPRYATVSQSLSAKTETTATIKWTSDSVIDYIWYSTDNGSTWTGINVTDGKSGTYIINGLSANTTYRIKTRVRHKASQFTTDSSAMSVTTYEYPYCTGGKDFMIGDKCTINLYNPLNRTVTVTFVCVDGATITNTTSGTSYKGINAESSVNKLYASIPNQTSADYDVRVTYSGRTSTKLGAGTYIIDRSECIPDIGVPTYEDTNSNTIAITENNLHIIQNQSTLAYAVGGLSAKNSATISSCVVEVNGDTYNLALSGSSASGTGGVIDSGTDVVATFTVTDSRGITNSRTVDITMLALSLPSAIINLQRHDNFYSDTDITVNADYSSLDGKNTIEISYKGKKAGTSEYTIEGTLEDNVKSTFEADNESVWDIVVTLTDLFGTTTYNLTLSRGMPIIYFDESKSSVGVNCFPKNENSLEVGGYDLFFHDGDKITLSGTATTSMMTSGVLTNSTKRVVFSVTLPRFVNGLDVTVKEMRINVWHVGGGYVLSNAFVGGGYNVLTDSTITVSASVSSGNTVTFSLDKSSAFSGTGNTPVAVMLNNLTLTFSKG